MEDKQKQPQNKLGNISNSPRPGAARMSAEDKLKKSLKNLSYTSSSGGMSGFSLNQEFDDDLAKRQDRKKVGGVVLDVETIKDANKQKLQTRGKRNNVLILVLGILLVASLVYLAVAIADYNKSKKDYNCRYFVSGEAGANCEWVVEDGQHTEFHLKSGLTADSIYLLDSRLKVNDTASVVISVTIKVDVNGKEFLIAGLYEDNNMERVDEDTNQFNYQATVTGGGTIELFKGIDFSGAPGNLSSTNINIEITANVRYA